MRMTATCLFASCLVDLGMFLDNLELFELLRLVLLEGFDIVDSFGVLQSFEDFIEALL